VCFDFLSTTFVSNGTIFGEEEGGATEHKMCVLIFSLQLLSQILFILRRTERVIINVLTSSRNVQVIFVRFQ